MPRYFISAFILTAILCAAARADEKYLLKENIAVGYQTHFQIVTEATSHIDTKVDGKLVNSADPHRREVLKGDLTVLEVKDGVATAIRLEIDPDSGMIEDAKDKPTVKTPSPFAGKTIVLRRRADDSVANDFQGTASKEEAHDLDSLLDPDQDNYLDHPVAVGDSWEISKQIAKRIDLGPKDQILAHCRLDSVKTENGKKVAHLSISAAMIQHEAEFIEEDVELTGTGQVDMATGIMFQSVLKGKIKMSGDTTTPDQNDKPKKIEVTGSGELNIAQADTPSTRPSTQP